MRGINEAQNSCLSVHATQKQQINTKLVNVINVVITIIA